jgi:hypothetical protein
MEHRRRTLSSAFDDDIVDIEKQVPRRRGTSASIDETIDEYTEYVYNGTFNFSNMFFRGLLNLICPCCRKDRGPVTIDNSSD